MKIIIAILMFCIVLFLYLHIFFHLKTSDDLEVYEIEQPSKDKLEEICDLRQPVIFDYNNEPILETCNIDVLSENYGAFDIKVRNVKENDDDTEMYVPLTLNAADKVFNDDSQERFLSENNHDFLEETGVIKSYRYNDVFLRPYMVSNCLYDYMMGSGNIETPLRYEVNYRNFYLVTRGSVKIKLIPPHASKYLYVNKDYDNFEFRSPVNPWNVQPDYKPDFDKIKTLEVEIKAGQIIFIPAFWWYSMKLVDRASICVFQYRTYMNVVAIMPYLMMNLLQRQNIKREIVKKKALLNEEEHIEDNTEEKKDK